MTHKIIGISGTNGSGKDTVGHILAEEHGYFFMSVTDVMRAELKRRELPVDREHMRELSAQWRREFGYGVLIDRAVAEYEKLTDTYSGLAIASLRNPHEVDKVHELGGVVWWLDADPLLRFTRIKMNAATRARAEEDEKTFEQFQAEEQAEMHQSGDEATLNMSGVKDKSDVLMTNGGNELYLLKQEIAALLL
jgi:cytidylate kinase